ncbi:uncharacterized protein LOC143845412 [Tasmannia lanceolata]|uniref:uncharacterized protein LOC143845412 n=1 Tax=Tasmannia lanceolata TaxID=3420 RepID=UPI004062E000
MAGIALLLDLLKKNPNFSSQALHSYGLFSATVAASAAAASISAGRPFASRFLFGDGGISVCDAGASWTDDPIASLRSASENFFQNDSIKYSTKEYHIEMKPLFSAFGLKSLAITSLRSLLLSFLPLLEPRTHIEADDEDFLEEDAPQEHPVDLVVPLKKSLKQIFRETAVVTTRRVLERLAVHYVSHRMAWKLLKDVCKSSTRKAERGMPTLWYFYCVSRTTFRGHLLGVAAQWLVQVGIDIYRFFSSITNRNEQVDQAEQIKLLRNRIFGTTVKCFASLVFASVGAGFGAIVFSPSIGQWIGCVVGDMVGPIIVTFFCEKVLHVDL